MRFVSSLAFLASLWAAAGCARPWPVVRGVSDPDFLAHGGVRTVAIVPMNVELAAGQSVAEPVEAIGARFEEAAAQSMSAALARKGYVDGEQADAVLYLSGFAYAGKPSGVDAGEVLVAVVAVVLIVGIIAMLASGSKGGHHGGHGGGHGGGAFAGGGGPRFGHAGGGAHLGHPGGGMHFGHHGGGGHAFAHLALDLSASPSVEDVPADGPSHALLELRLVDSRTGRLLWRAGADFPADPGRPEEVEEAIGRLASTLPPARL